MQRTTYNNKNSKILFVGENYLILFFTIDYLADPFNERYGTGQSTDTYIDHISDTLPEQQINIYKKTGRNLGKKQRLK